MTDIEARLFPKVGCGCENLLPLFVYLYNNYSKDNIILALNYFIKNGFTGMKLAEILVTDFQCDFDRLLKHAISKAR